MRRPPPPTPIWSRAELRPAQPSWPKQVQGRPSWPPQAADEEPPPPARPISLLAPEPPSAPSLLALRPLEDPEVKRALAEVRQSAQAEAEQKLQQMQEEARTRLREALGQLSDLRRRAAPDPRELVSLAMVVARELIGHELRQNPERLSAAIQEALRPLEGEPALSLRLHPDDAAWARENCPSLKEQGVLLVEDPSLAPGDCAAETPTRASALTLSARLDAIRERLITALAQEEL